MKLQKKRIILQKNGEFLGLLLYISKDISAVSNHLQLLQDHAILFRWRFPPESAFRIIVCPTFSRMTSFLPG